MSHFLDRLRYFTAPVPSSRTVMVLSQMKTGNGRMLTASAGSTTR
ncbi:hypothetical protein HDG33_003713 [Paraburkholderia sp. Cpub6]|nr:hypothetical protein [Paraburkholderia sp. Cpub6]